MAHLLQTSNDRSWNTQRYKFLGVHLALRVLEFILAIIGSLVKIIGCGFGRKLDQTEDGRSIPSERDLLPSQEIDSRERVREVRHQITPLPKRRERALTLGSKMFDEADRNSLERTKSSEGPKRDQGSGLVVGLIRQSTMDQLGTCDLYRFPLEIRERIWRYAIGGDLIHIVKLKDRLGSVYCPEENPMDVDRIDICCRNRDEQGLYKRTAWPSHPKPLALISSCRQIYSETIDLLYAINTFSFDECCLLQVFFSTLLPHRKELVCSVHLSVNFCPRPAINYYRPLRFLYEPNNSSLEEWSHCIHSLNGQPALYDVTVTTPSYWFIDVGFNEQQGCGERWMKSFLSLLNEVQVKGKLSLAWPPEAATSKPYWWGSQENLPANHKFSIQQHSYRDEREVLTFFFPFHVQCLHCSSYTIIPRMTRSRVVSTLYRASAEPLAPHFEWWHGAEEAGKHAQISLYWAYHRACGGWLEIRYDWEHKYWSVSQGGRKCADDEVEAYWEKIGYTEPETESYHELLQSLTLKSLMVSRRRASSRYGEVIDEPAREFLYRSAGWVSKDERDNAL